MKKLFLLASASLLVSLGHAQTNFNTLTNLLSFGPNGDGSLRPGQRSYVATGDRNRGMSYNPFTTNVILIDRETNGANSTHEITGTINVLGGLNGTNIYTGTAGSGYFGLATNGMGGGDFVDHAVAVADDGVVYICNLVNNSASNEAFVIYRWVNDSPTNTDGTTNFAYVCYSNNPGGAGFGTSWGISMDVRGAGTNTQIICGSRDGPSLSWNAFGTNVAVFTTTDGSNFTDHVLSIDQPEDSYGRAGGIAFGAGDTFWAVTGTRTVNPSVLFHVAFDLNAGTTTTLQTFNTNAMVPPLGFWGSIAVDATNNLLAVLDFGASATVPDHVRLYDIENLNAPPVLLDIKDFPINRTGTMVGFLDFGGGRLYVHSMNSGLMAFTVTPGAGSNTPPAILTQPSPALTKVAPGGSTSYQVIAARALGYQWRLNGTDLPGETGYTLTLNNIQNDDVGDYTVVLTNTAGATTSSVVAVQLVFPDDFPHFSSLWNLAPTTRPYLVADTSTAGNVPFYRSLGYNALSNQVYIVCRDSAGTSILNIPVLDGDTGNDLYFLKTNGINLASANFILNCIAVADDGAVYACNMHAPNATTTAVNFRIFRWADSGSNTSPVLVRSGDPTGPAGVGTNNIRWGDSFCVRGSGTNTLLAADAGTNGATTIGHIAAVFAPTNEFLTNFVSLSNGFVRIYNNGLQTSIGRSIQFGPTNTLWQKRKSASGARLELSSYDLINRNSTLLTNFTSLPAGIGAVAIDESRHLLAGINFKTGVNNDSLDIYDISDLTAPVLLDSENFPIAHQPNANFIGQVVIGPNKIFALDGNNGIVAVTIIPALVPTLTAVRSGSSTALSWTNSVSGWKLQSNTNLLTGTWADMTNTVSVVNNMYTATDVTTADTKFYRLRK